MKEIQHQERKCEAHIRDKNGNKVRDKSGKYMKHDVVVPAYTQVIR